MTLEAQGLKGFLTGVRHFALTRSRPCLPLQQEEEQGKRAIQVRLRWLTSRSLLKLSMPM